MYIIKRSNNIRLIYIDKSFKEHGIRFNTFVYKVQIKFFLFWITIKEFDERDRYDADDCFAYCTNPYKI